MKRILLFFVAIGIISMQSCTINEGTSGRDGLDGQDAPLSEVFELKNVNFTNSGNGYQIYQTLNPKIYASDVILIYRLSGFVNNNNTIPVWQPIPRTLFLTQGELDYDFDFSKQDFTIYAGGTFNLALQPTFINNQTFRIVIVPGAFSNRSVNLTQMSYEEVLAKYNINDAVVTQLN